MDERSSPLFDAAGLLRALSLVLMVFLPTAALALLWLAVAYLLDLSDPDRFRAEQTGLDAVIIGEHVRRAETIRDVDIALFGDSSCATDIDVPTLGKRLGSKVEAFCTASYPGPANYAKLVDKILDRGIRPKAVIVMLHPIQLERQAEWDNWLAKALPKQAAHPGFFTASLDYLKGWIASYLFKPIPGWWGMYYGGTHALANYIASHNGSFIDARVGLDVHSEADFLQGRMKPPTTVKYQQPYAVNALFEQSLDVLATSLQPLGHKNVFVILSPVPRANFPDQGEEPRRQAAEAVAARLTGISDRILTTPASYPDKYFSIPTHLNRWGRIAFTQVLVDELRRRLDQVSR